MKKNLLYYSLGGLAFWLIIIASTSCDKLPQNGELDGMWQVMTLEKDGKTLIMKDSMVYWSFRMNVAQFTSNFKHDSRIYYSHFHKSNQTLSFNDFCKAAAYESVTDNNEWINITESTILNKWCLYPNKDPNHQNKVSITYKIEKLTSSSLILYNNNEKITFRKF